MVFDVFVFPEKDGHITKMEPKLIHLERIWEGFVCLVGVFLELGEHSDFFLSQIK